MIGREYKMKKTRKNILLSLILSATVLLCSCSGIGSTDSSSTQASSKENNTQAATQAFQSDNDAKEKLAKMSTDEKIGQLIITGFQGYEVDESLTSLIKDYHVGGTILFSRNAESAQQMVNLNNEIIEANGNNTPMFITMDEEGGMVTRLPDDIQSLPSPYTIAATGSKDLCYKFGKQLGTQISSLGFCTGNSPDLDIWSNPDNTVIGDRAYGKDTESVITYGMAAMNGIRDGGAIPVGKHFPGHGDTSVDSHYGLPIVTKTLDELNNMEFAPFKEAIKQGIPAIMVTHIILDSVDNEYPSSMSDKVVNGILRNELGFSGVCFSDDMTMGAITDNFSIEKASVMAINAGVDCLLICHEYENTLNVIKAIKEAVTSGVITQDRLNEAVLRILTLKHDYSVTNNKIQMPDIQAMNATTEDLLSKIQ